MLLVFRLLLLRSFSGSFQFSILCSNIHVCGGFYLFRGNSFDFFVAVVFHFVLYDRKTIAFKSVNVTKDQRHRKAALNWNLNWAEPPPQMRFWLQKSYHSSPPKYGLDRQIGSWGVSSRLIIMRSPAHFPHSFIKYTDTLLCGVLIDHLVSHWLTALWRKEGN